MRLTYIHHSAFLLETEDCALLFDYTEGTLPALPALPLYVFVSHAHQDHYTKQIYGVRKTAEAAGAPSVTFIVSKDCPAEDAPGRLRGNVIFMEPHEHYEDMLIQVDTLVSNDAGVAFVIAVSDGLVNEERIRRQIYFAGDLNAWNWDGDEEDMALIRIYHEELARVKGRLFDVAFIPLDPRLNEAYVQGVTDFFRFASAQVIAPMHCWGRYEIIEKARAQTADGAFLQDILPIRNEGDVFQV